MTTAGCGIPKCSGPLIILAPFALMISFPSAADGGIAIFLSNEFETTAGWPGFDSQPDINWHGQTVQLDFSRHTRPGGGGTTGVVITNGIPPAPHPKPVELLEKSQQLDVDTRADIYVADQSGSASYRDRSKYSRLARYSEVIDLDDYVLGRASSLVTMDGDATDLGFSMISRMDLDHEFDPIIANRSWMRASADAFLDASYQVKLPSRFQLSGTFSGIDKQAVQFTITDRDSGDLYYEQAFDQFDGEGATHSFSLYGKLTQGVYDFSFSAGTSGFWTVDGDSDHGGVGEFEIDLDWIPWAEDAADLNASGKADHADLFEWSQNYARTDDVLPNWIEYWQDYGFSTWRDSSEASDITKDGYVAMDDYLLQRATDLQGDIDNDRDRDGSDFLLWQQAASLDVPDLHSPIGRWEVEYGGTSTSSDVDQDGSINGMDFLQLQRGYAAAARTISQQIPEPTSVSLVLLGLIGLSSRATSR